MEAATTTFAEIMDSVITTTVSLARTIITEYWPYILIIGAISALIVWFKKLAHVGTK